MEDSNCRDTAAESVRSEFGVSSESGVRASSTISDDVTRKMGRAGDAGAGSVTESIEGARRV